ncbi:Hypothetical protein SMAX5B_021689 [Scophthalmus maximus]|uniref:Uncharacterized protein n=1 Tax=Scophthalmus maximus TaxID=52904 RepID=A0A2U9CCU2_SCOMX|nr:Hypothetical protein SMAX5B_021689 [Scophthalmus maximus]
MKTTNVGNQSGPVRMGNKVVSPWPGTVSSCNPRTTRVMLLVGDKGASVQSCRPWCRRASCDEQRLCNVSASHTQRSISTAVSSDLTFGFTANRCSGDPVNFGSDGTRLFLLLINRKILQDTKIMENGYKCETSDEQILPQNPPVDWYQVIGEPVEVTLTPDMTNTTWLY